MCYTISMRIATTLLLILFAVPSFAQQLTPELELKQEILRLQVALQAEKQKTAKALVAYGQCTESLLRTADFTPLFEKFKSEVEAENPGFSYDVERGTFTPKAKS